MFNVGECVVYNSTGVYRVVDICQEKNISDIDTEYYVLQPAFDKNSLTIKIPTHNPKVMLRGILTKEDALTSIANMRETEAKWIDNDRERNVTFKSALRTGDSDKWIRLIKTIYLEKQERSSVQKKLSKTDEEIMKTAEKYLYEELALALSIEPNEVLPYIQSQIS